MKFGSTVTSIWRVMARYMRTDLSESSSFHSYRKIRTEQSRRRYKSPRRRHFPSRFQHSSILNAPPRHNPRILFASCGPILSLSIVQAAKIRLPHGV